MECVSAPVVSAPDPKRARANVPGLASVVERVTAVDCVSRAAKETGPGCSPGGSVTWLVSAIHFHHAAGGGSVPGWETAACLAT